MADGLVGTNGNIFMLFVPSNCLLRRLGKISLLLIFLHAGTLVFAQQASLNGNVLSLPVVTFQDLAFRVDLILLDNTADNVLPVPVPLRLSTLSFVSTR